MKLFQPVQQAIEQLDAKSFRNYLIAFFVIFGLIVGFLFYQYYGSIRSLQQKMNSVNDQREEVKEISIRHELAKDQQREVEALLKKEPNFRITEYFDSVLQQHTLTDNLVRKPESSRTDLDTDHREVTLVANLKNLNMKTIAELLDTLERKERIYTKDIEIIKQTPTARTVNLNLTIATLEPTAGAAASPAE